MKHLIITAIGSDRIGLAESIADEVIKRECNIEESKMAVLGGEFAVILLISGEDTCIDELLSYKHKFANKLDMHVEMHKTKLSHSNHLGLPYIVESVSMDTPGIVYSLTSILSSYSINIEDLETSTSAAPWTGAPMFRMRARIIIPPKVQVSQLRIELNEVAMEKDLDISVVPDVPSL